MEDFAVSLYIPRWDELGFYRKMLSDPATMAYNAPWFPPDGCIDFPASEWQAWHARWIGQEPERFFAYLRRKSDGAFVGNVNFHKNPDRGWWDMGVVINAPERGKGYGKMGLRLLLDRAFREDGVNRLHNEFENGREAACRIHLAAGFRKIGVKDGVLQLELTREEYLSESVTVVIDRPLGSRHPTHAEIVYPVNYGYVPGVFAADGEEQDAYVLGVDQPVESFSGKRIAVIRRADDAEDKWVVAPEGMRFTKEQIMEMVGFQERFFDSSVFLREELK